MPPLYAAEPLEQRLLLAVLYVDLNAPGPLHDGSSWPSAYPDLQPALLAAKAGDTIRLATGTYKPTTDTDRTKSFQLKNAVAIYGGYAGHNAPNPDQRDIQRYPTILSGDIGTPGDNTDNSYHVLTASGLGPSTVLDGLSVTEGNANGLYSDQRSGGGLYATGSSPTLTNCSFASNSGAYGGGISNSSSSPTLTNCSFSGNSANYSGGGMSNVHSSPTLTNCSFIGNSAQTGGGMCNEYSSSPTLTNCTFSGNSASFYGGGMYNVSSSPTLTNCIVWGNSSGAIYNDSKSTPKVTFSDIQGGYPGTGNINADPRFVLAPWAGPDGLFGTADDDPGDLRLRAGSPCIDKGNNAAIPPGFTTDLASNPRIQNGTVDMGIYEGPNAAPAPKTLYVDAAAAGTNTGSSWANAFTSLQSALQAAADGDTIRIADGTYKPSSSNDRTASFVLRNAVGLYGGYAGYGASDPDSRDIALYPTILSGEIGTPGYASDNSFHVLTASGVGPSTVLDGLTVTGGNANSFGSNRSYGGGMYNNSSSPTLTNCSFSSNSASGYFGGGLYNYSSSSPTLTNCIVWGNGSAIANSSGCTPKVTYSLIQGGYPGLANLNADPQFLRPPSRGPDGQWATADDDYGDLRLQPTSPARNAGLNSALPSTLTTDLAGNPRLVGGTVDLGAYEYQNDELILAGVTADSFQLRINGPTLEIFRNTAPDQAPPTQSVPLKNLTRLRLQGGQYTLASDLTGLVLYLENDSQVKLASSQRLASLSLSPNATLDLVDNDLIVSATRETKQAALAAISTAIKSARGRDGKWLGSGLGSSLAKANKQTGLAILLNEKDGKPILTSFAGQSVGENDILVKYTWNGDVNLDGMVDAADYFLVDSGFITQQGQYRNGDLNFDGQVDAADYFLIDSAFIAQSGALAAEQVPAATEGSIMLKAAIAARPQTAPSVLAQLFSIEPVL